MDMGSLQSNVRYKKEPINSLTIINWMNEWSPTDDCLVPKFEKEEDFEKGDIRIKFGSESITSQFFSMLSQITPIANIHLGGGGVF